MQRADEPAHVLEVAGAAVALGEVRLEAHAFAVGQRALEVVGHELDELAADERVADLAAAPRSASAVTSTSGNSASRTAGTRAVQQHALVDLGELEQRRRPLSGGTPTRSRSVITARWAGDRSSTASSRCSRSSALSRPLSGSASSRGGALIQRPSASNAAGSTAGRSSLSSAENGTLRASRTARVRARLTRMRKIQVRRDERPSKSLVHGSPPATSPGRRRRRPRCVRTNVRATRRSDGSCRSTRASNAASSPARRRSRRP